MNKEQLRSLIISAIDLFVAKKKVSSTAYIPLSDGTKVTLDHLIASANNTMKGAPGANGPVPLLRTQTTLSGEVIVQVFDWVVSPGQTKPAIGFIGPNGIVIDPADATIFTGRGIVSVNYLAGGDLEVTYTDDSTQVIPSYFDFNADNLFSLTNKTTALQNLGIGSAVRQLSLLTGDADDRSDTVSSLRAYNGDAIWGTYITTLNALFRYDESDTTTADNGTSVIIDAQSRRYKKTSILKIIKESPYV